MTELRVTPKGPGDIDLYFDRESGLLVKKRITRVGPDGKAVVFETLFSDVKEFDGVKLWTKSVTYRDGVKRFEIAMVEARFRDRLPASTFAKP